MSSKESSSYRSQKATANDLSLLEKLDIIPAVLGLVTTTILTLFTAPFRDTEKTPKSYFRHVALTSVRYIFSRTTPRQQHYMNAPTDDAYIAACKKRKQQPNSLILEDGTRAHWIGNSSAEKLLINFHGGGYTLPASEGMFEFMFQVVESVESEGKNMACLFLSYDCAPGAIYPRQLQQAAMLLNHVLQEMNTKPSNIILSGDSAGANLVTQVLSHISHPHPSTALPIPPIKLDAPLRGAVLISPWVDFDITAPSFTKNERKDCIATAFGTQWSAAFLACPWPHTSASDYYNQAQTAPASWWKDLQVQEVLIVAGEEEVLVDGIIKFEKKLSEGMGAGKVEILIADGEYHDQPSLDVQLGYKAKDEGMQAKKIKTWISSKL